jgi:hypothetical protein
MYDKGQGVPQEYAAAARWYREAAEQGQNFAQYFLGNMYGGGKGVTQDYVLAHMWLTLSRHKDAIFNRDVVASKMTPAQIAEAQKLAREWKPKSSP